ncbi:MAG: hypothetical protein IT449_12700 [Phycisphaerales bacterium]|nr:hypothetical protein [Phycisphaerales bacterium]
MNIVFLASGEFALPSLRWLANSPDKVGLVVTQPPRPKGRGKRLTPTPVAAFAREAGLTVAEVEDINAPVEVERLRAARADLGLVIAFGQKLGEAVRSSFARACVNLHASVLPNLRGAAPIQWAVLRGMEETGVTVFRIVERMDAGPILVTRSTAIKPEETAEELHDRLAAIGVDAVRATFDLFAEGANPPGEPQDDAASTRAPKLKKEDGATRFDRPAREVARHVLGMWSWPGATARFEAQDGRWENVTLARVRRPERVEDPRSRSHHPEPHPLGTAKPETLPLPAQRPDGPRLAAGTLDARRFVACADGFLEILEIKPASGQRMTWQEYVNGRHVRAGDRLAPPDAT